MDNKWTMPIYGRPAQGTYNMPSGGYFLCELEWMARTEPRPKIYNSFVVPHLFIMLVWWWWWWWWRFPPYLRIHRGRPERGHIITNDDGLDRVVDRHNANELNTIAQAEEKTTTPNEMMLNVIPMPLLSCKYVDGLWVDHHHNDIKKKKTKK